MMKKKEEEVEEYIIVREFDFVRFSLSEVRRFSCREMGHNNAVRAAQRLIDSLNKYQEKIMGHKRYTMKF